MTLAWKFNDIPPTDGNKPQSLIVVMHSFGDSKETFQNVGGYFSENLPQSRILIPDAPQSFYESLPSWAHYVIKKKTPPAKYEQGMKGRSWFTINPLTLPLNIKFNRIANVENFNRFITCQLDQDNLPDERLVLFGFSQGGTMAILSALKRDKECAAVIAHSASLPATFKPANRQKIDLVKGDGDIANDKKLAIKLIRMTDAGTQHRLSSMNTPYENHVIEGLTHSINDESLEKSVQIIKRGLDPMHP